MEMTLNLILLLCNFIMKANVRNSNGIKVWRERKRKSGDLHLTGSMETSKQTSDWRYHHKRIIKGRRNRNFNERLLDFLVELQSPSLRFSLTWMNFRGKKKFFFRFQILNMEQQKLPSRLTISFPHLSSNSFSCYFKPFYDVCVNMNTS